MPHEVTIDRTTGWPVIRLKMNRCLFSKRESYVRDNTRQFRSRFCEEGVLRRIVTVMLILTSGDTMVCKWER